MTDYARDFLDECAISFTNRIAECDSLKFSLITPMPPKAFSAERAATFFEKEYEAFRAIKKAYALGEAINIILKLRDIQIQEASWQTGLATSQITRLKTDKHKHSLRLLAQFCAGLGLEPYISRSLIDKAGISLASPTQEDFVYMWIVDTMSGNTIDVINKTLSDNYIEPFNKAKENR